MSHNLNKESIKEFRRVDPTRKAVSMAQELGITRERVRQILNDLSLPTSFYAISQTCLNKECSNTVPKHRISQTCSSEYATALRMGEFTCAFCGKIKKMRKSLIQTQKNRYKNLHCSRSCSSKGYWKTKKEYERIT